LCLFVGAVGVAACASSVPSLSNLQITSPITNNN
jgi:hypothetical protein